MSENTQKRLPAPYVTLAYILSGLTIACAVFVGIAAPTVGEKLIAVVDVAIAVLAVLYFKSGFGKDANKYYRMLFMIVAASILLDALFTCLFIGNTADAVGVAWIFIALIFYGNMLILGVAKDLGKIPSLCLIISCAILYAVVTVLYLVALIKDPSLAAGVDFVGALAWFFGALVGVIMVAAKYSDKAVRGTK